MTWIDARARWNQNHFTLCATSLEHYRIAAPSLPVAWTFSDIAGPLFDAIRCNMNESRKLAQLRDYLLPKLLSGQVRVRDVERVTEQAVV